MMKRSLFAFVAAAAVVAFAPSSAFAAVIELGQTKKSPVLAPTCPKGVSKANCTIILTETTAVEALTDSLYYPTTVTVPGRLVAFTVGLARLARTDIQNLNAAYGGPSQVAITVLKRTKKPPFLFTVKYESPLVSVQPWFGYVVQFPLSASLPLQTGDIVGLTVKTWAPVLSINLPTDAFRYRASRQPGASGAGCTTFNLQTAQLSIGAKAQYTCFYVATRVQYTATEVTNPVVPSNAIRSRPAR